MNKHFGLRCASLVAITLVAAAAQANVIYSNLSTGLPGNPISYGYQAVSISELGDHIQFDGGARNLQSVTVTMSNWALASTYGSTAAGYDHDLTFNLYNYNAGLATTLIASKTITTSIPWRPEADEAKCGVNSTKWYSALSGMCHSGLGFNVTFDFSSLGIVLPDDLVFGLAFNTQSFGSNPTGASGPYNSLNFGLALAPPTVGTNVDPDSLFWYNSSPTEVVTGTLDVFSKDSGFGSLTPLVAFEAVPEPASLALFGLGLAGLAFSRRRKSV